MTLILGMICGDGVVIAADSKTTSNKGKPRYDEPKIFNTGGIAIAFSGTGMHPAVRDAISGSVEYFLENNPNVLLKEVADKVLEQATKYLIRPETWLAILVADNSNLYIVQVPAGTIQQEDSAILGIKEVKLLPPIKETSTKAYERHFKKIIEKNVGRTVGGPTQVVILKK